MNSHSSIRSQSESSKNEKELRLAFFLLYLRISLGCLQTVCIHHDKCICIHHFRYDSHGHIHHCLFYIHRYLMKEEKERNYFTMNDVKKV